MDAARSRTLLAILLATIAVALVAAVVRFAFGLITVGATWLLGLAWAAATAALLWLARDQGLRGKRLVAVAILAAAIVAVPVTLSPYGHEKAQLVKRLDLPGAQLFEIRSTGGPNICFDSCPWVEAWYAAEPGPANESMERFAEALRRDGWREHAQLADCDAGSCGRSFDRRVVNAQLYLRLEVGEEAARVVPYDGQHTTPWPENRLAVRIFLD